jgi:hypothetical protein
MSVKAHQLTASENKLLTITRFKRDNRTMLRAPGKFTPKCNGWGQNKKHKCMAATEGTTAETEAYMRGLKTKVKVKFTLEQAMKAQRGVQE